MEIVLLGTGAADGWPNAWCTCPSCTAALQQGVLREQTCAVVNGRLAIDFGLHGPRAALRTGRSFADIDTILVTHDHEDHLSVASFMHREAVVDPRPITLVGPAGVVEYASRYLLPGDSAVTVEAGQEISAGGFEVRVIHTKHDDEAGPSVLYDVTDDSEARLFYATDTGQFSDLALAQVADREFDLVLLELTSNGRPSHLDLDTWPGALDALRGVGATRSTTEIVAVHMGHGNPPPDILDSRLASLGARAGRDGERILVRG